LREVGTKLATTLRGIDATARLGGDEFAILLSETDAVQGELALERIQKSLSLTLRSVRAAAELGVTASIGAVVFSGGTATSDDLLGEADAIMYRTKHERPGSISVEAPEAWNANSRLASATTRSDP
jgi:diguanylate cyclase (GGDEF)-like protein